MDAHLIELVGDLIGEKSWKLTSAEHRTGSSFSPVRALEPLLDETAFFSVNGALVLATIDGPGGFTFAMFIGDALNAFEADFIEEEGTLTFTSWEESYTFQCNM